MINNYGLTLENPIMCGGGLSSGPDNSKKYPSRLICPNGKSVKFERTGSINPLMKAMQEGAKGSKEDILEDINKAVKEGYISRLMSPDNRSIDVYEVVCGCGLHKTTIYVNMYGDGPDKPIGLQGWSINV